MIRAQSFEDFVQRRAGSAFALPPGARKKLRREYDGLIAAGRLRESTVAAPLDDMGRRVFGIAA